MKERVNTAPDFIRVTMTKVSRVLSTQVRKQAQIIILSIVVFFFYQVLIYHTPTLYWNDAHIRVALRNELLLGEWLPGVQAIVVLASMVTSDLHFLRSVMSLVAIGSLICLYVLSGHLFSPMTGLIAFALLAFNGMFAAFGIVPYPEVLFLGFLFLVIVLLDTPIFSKRFNIGLLLLNLACLIRYEGWFLALFFITDVAFRSIRENKGWAAIPQTLKMILSCCLAPFIWLIFGVSASGGLKDRLLAIFEFVIAPSASSVRDHIFTRLSFDYLDQFTSQFFHLLISQVDVQFLVMALIGFFAASFTRPYKSIHLKILLILCLNWCLLAVFQPWKIGSLRQPFLMLVFVILYSSHGLVVSIQWIFQKISWLLSAPYISRWSEKTIVVITVMIVAILIPSSYDFVVKTSREYDFYVPYKIGTWLSSRFVDGEAVLILDDTDYYPYALATYFDHPLEEILDDRLDARIIQGNLNLANKVYVIVLYRSRDGLLPVETKILNDLEDGRIQAERFVLDEGIVWYAPTSEILYLP